MPFKIAIPLLHENGRDPQHATCSWCLIWTRCHMDPTSTIGRRLVPWPPRLHDTTARRHRHQQWTQLLPWAPSSFTEKSRVNGHADWVQRTSSLGLRGGARTHCGSIALSATPDCPWSLPEAHLRGTALCCRSSDKRHWVRERLVHAGGAECGVLTDCRAAAPMGGKDHWTRGCLHGCSNRTQTHRRRRSRRRLRPAATERLFALTCQGSRRDHRLHGRSGTCSPQHRRG